MSSADDNEEEKKAGAGSTVRGSNSAEGAPTMLPHEELAREDPVCKMQVFPSRAAANFAYNGTSYYFCNPRCKETFEKNPQKYLPSPGEGTAAAEGGPAEKSAATNKTAAPADLNDLKAYYLPEAAFDYICSMDQEVRQKKPGSCPKCGMVLLPAVTVSSSDYESGELHGLRLRLLPCAILTLVLLAISMPEMLAPLLFGQNMKHSAANYWPYLQLLLASPVVLWGAAPIFQKALRAAREKQMNMFTLIAFGVSISFLLSLINLFAPEPSGAMATGAMAKMLYFESAASIVTLVLFGQILELKARASGGRALESLFALAPSKARRETVDQSFEDIPVFEVARGDRLRILPGDKIPADGLVLSGRSSVDESLLTGNALPVTRAEGERVLAGTINGDGSLLIQAETLGRDTFFAQIVDLLASAQSSRSPIQLIADRTSAIFIPSVLVLAAATFLGWFFLGGQTALPHAIQNMVAVLVIACPCALGLATPIAVSTAVARASKLGLMVKDARALEMLAGASDVLIDKTGTLTKGKFEIVGISAEQSLSENEALKWAASLEQGSKHPLAVSICAAAQARGIPLVQPTEIQYTAGLGLEGIVGTHKVLVGSARFMHEKGIDPDVIKVQSMSQIGATTNLYLSLDSSLKAVIELADTLKEESVEFVAQLRALSLRPRILSGDGKASVVGAAAILKIAEEDLHFDLLPQGKVEQIRRLQAEGRVVAMLGDGVNDAAALAAADAGIAMASGSDLALSSAAISVMHADLRSIAQGIKLARLMTATMKENLFLAFIYNTLALLLATGILYPSTGIELNPSIAAAAMSLSSLSVILNSLKIARANL